MEWQFLCGKKGIVLETNLIIVEGLPGSGKSTTAAMIADELEKKGKSDSAQRSGGQYTSKAFIEFCESAHVTQSMSKAGSYDNAPMERYFNTRKSE